LNACGAACARCDAFEHHALGDRSDDVAGEVVVGTAAEGPVGGDRPGEIFLGDLLDPSGRMLAQRFPGIDLMTRDPNVHLARLLSNVGGAAA